MNRTKLIDQYIMNKLYASYMYWYGENFVSQHLTCEIKFTVM